MANEKTQYRLLIVDDDATEIDKYKDAIFLINSQSLDLQIDPYIYRTLEEGKKALLECSFDGALIDLKLSSTTNDPEYSGNNIIKQIKRNLRFPVVVYSGFPGDLDADLGDETCFYKIYNRTEKTAKAIFEELINIHRRGIVDIIGRDGVIDRYLNNIFWDYLARAASDWSDIEPENLEKMMLRYTVLHLQEYLEINDDGKFELFHPYEMYIIPPIKEKPFTGSIYRRDEKNYIILSPACDLAHENRVRLAVMAEIEKIDMDYVKALKIKIVKNDEETEKAQRDLEALVKNSSSLKYHFLPQCQSFKGGFINFQKIRYEKLKDITDSYEPIASISASYIKDIIARFSHYYSRQGQPDMDFTKIVDFIVNL
jgi:hypothetical protein